MADDVTIETIKAEPFKRFFIDILTRDIELIAAILELVDNAVDSARELRADGEYTDLKIEIEADKKRFSIEDNCAGISLEAARDYVFRIGRPENAKTIEGSIGQFGVGMKRALFKMGSAFSVESVTKDSHFELELDVDKWEKQPNWDLELRVHAAGANGFPPTGTTVIVDSLLPPVSVAFGTESVIRKLHNELESKHRTALERGMVIILNGQKLAVIPTQLAVSAAPQPLLPGIERFSLTDDEKREISISIFVGVSPQSETVEDEEPENVAAAEDKAGWYVFGNGRLLIAADKSALTGWSGAGNMPLFHNQFSRFRGYVYMNAVDPTALPWNTTKTGVETSDPIWIKVQGEMIKQGKLVIGMLNSLKKERGSVPIGVDLPITESLKAAKNVVVSNFDGIQSQRFSFPAPNPALDVRTSAKSISYSVTKEEFAAVSDAMGETTAAAVGRGTFDYYYRRQVELEE